MTVAGIAWPGSERSDSRPAVAAHGNSVLLLRPLSTVLGRLGVDADRFLADVGVEPGAPAGAYVPNLRVDGALEAIAAARGDETFGLTLAREAVARSPVGLFGHLVWLSRTLREALTQAARFYSLVTQRATLALDEDGSGEGAPGAGDAGVAVFTQRMKPGAPRGRILSEYMFAALVLRARSAAGDAFRVRAMRFAHACRSCAPYEDLFEARVTFDDGDAGLDTLAVDAALLALPLSTADPFTAAALEAQIADLRVGAGPQGAPRLLDRVRDAVQGEIGGGRPSLASIARRLGVGGRALRRQLEDQRVSLRAVVAAAMSDRATERLAQGASIKEVAFELGFSEPSAFSRAYKRWTGRPPSMRSTGTKLPLHGSRA